MVIDLREREREERSEGKKSNIYVREKNINQLLPIRTLTGDRTHNLVCALTRVIESTTF